MEINPLKGSLFRSTEIKCPACRKINSDILCSRCGCELEPLFKLIALAEFKIRAGIKALKEKDYYKAGEFALEAWGIKNTKESALLGFTASCLRRDKNMAALWYKRVNMI